MKTLVVAIQLTALALVTGVAVSIPLAARLLPARAAGFRARLGSRCCRWWSRAALRIVGLEVRIEGRPRGEPFVVAANHLSYLDIWLLGAAYPTVFVAKREIASWPLFGLVARVVGTVFVDREHARDLVRAAREMEAQLDHGVPLTLFPEGMATSGHAVLEFLPSLFEPAARRRIPCYAASLSYDTPGGEGAPSDTVCWWGGRSFLPHLLRLLRQPRVLATLRISAEPIVLSDRKELARQLHARSSAMFSPVRHPLEGSRGQSRGTSQTSAPKWSHGSRPSSQEAGSGEKCRSAK